MKNLRKLNAEEDQKRKTQRVVHTIHEGFINGRDTKATQKRHIKEARVAFVGVVKAKEFRLSQTPRITFTNDNAKGIAYAS